MLAGGFDDLSEEGSYEFANMKATSNSETEFAMGREPAEMSRPTTTTRSGVSLRVKILRSCEVEIYDFCSSWRRKELVCTS